MRTWNNLNFIIYSTVISMVGIIMMLVLDGIYDEIMLILAIIPILSGCYHSYKVNKK